MSQQPDQQVQVNLRDLGIRYLGATQRAFDVASCAVGALRLLNENEYDLFAHSPRIMPLQSHRAPFDTAREATEDFLARNLIGECANLLLPFLEDCRTVAALAAWKAGGGTDQAAVQKIITDDRKSFVESSLADKLRHLRDTFGIAHPAENALPGLLSLGICLAQRGGIVAKQDLTEGETLALRLLAVEVGAADAHGNAPAKLIEVRREFCEGQKAALRNTDVLAAIATISYYFNGILLALGAKVRELLPDEAAAPAEDLRS